MTAMQSELTTPTRVRTEAQRFALDKELAQKAVQKTNLQAQYDRLDLRAREVRQQAIAVLEKRAAAVTKYQRATGQLVTESGILKKWDKRLTSKDNALTKKKVAKATPAISADSKLRTLSAYVSFDFDVEKQRLFDSFPPLPE